MNSFQIKISHLAYYKLLLALACLPSLAMSEEVLSRDDFISAYQGRWAIPFAPGPKAAEGGHDSRRTGYSTGVHVLMPDGKIRLKTHVNDLFGYAVIDPPSPVLGPDVAIADLLGFGEIGPPSLANTPTSSGSRNHGWYIDPQGNEFVSMKAYYATAGIDFPSQMKNGDGFHRVTGEPVPDILIFYHHNKVAGYMCAPPISQPGRWDYMLGLVGTPGAGTTSAGISLVGVKWKTDGESAGEKPFAEALIMHDWGNKVADYSDNMLQIRGCAWIETSLAGKPKQAIIFMANRAKGIIWYGRGDGYLPSQNEYINKPADYPATPLYYTAEPTAETLTDPYSNSKGNHSEDIDRGFFIIDASKLEQGNFQVYPEDWISLDELGWLDNVNNWNNELVETSNRRGDISASYDAKSGKLLMTASRGYSSSRYESTPLFLEFHFLPAPAFSDPDNDGIPTTYEAQYSFLNPSNPDDAELDQDGDNLTNLEEFQLGTNPALKDTDNDGIPDGYEIENGLNPLDNADCPSWICNSSNSGWKYAIPLAP